LPEIVDASSPSSRSSSFSDLASFNSLPLAAALFSFAFLAEKVAL
jgi:hypothetical protein